MFEDNKKDARETPFDVVLVAINFELVIGCCDIESLKSGAGKLLT